MAIATQFGQFAVRMFQDRFIVLLLVEQYFTHRDILLMEGLRSGIQNPLGGLGLAGFAQVGSRGSHPHNIFVEAFAEGDYWVFHYCLYRSLNMCAAGVKVWGWVTQL